MADVNKTVEIALKITGTQSTDGLTKIVDLFKNLKTAVDAAKKSITSVQGALDTIKAPTSLNEIVTGFTKLGSVKVANLDKMATGFQKLADMGKPPDLSTFVSELQAFSKVKFPSITGLVTGLKNLDKMGAPPDLSTFVSELKTFSKVKLPSMTGLVTGMQKLSAMGKPPDLSAFVTELKTFSGIKLPGVSSIATGFKNLIALDVNAVVSKIQALNAALKTLDKRGGIETFKTFAADINSMNKSVGSAAASIGKIQTAITAAGQAATDSGLRIKTFADKVKTVLQFRLISAGLLAMRDAFTNGVTAIMEYDQALRDLEAITGATASEVLMMGATIIDVASKTKFSATEVAEGMKIIGQAGFTAGEAIQTMQSVSDLATGTLSSMGTSVDLVTTAMRVFRIDASNSAVVADVFANAVNRSKLTIDKLRTSMNYVGPIARDAGVTFKETAAAMGTLANSGLRASTIGTGLRNIFAGLISPSKKLRAAAHEAGVALEDLDTRTNTLPTVLSNLSLVLKDSSTALEIFGKRGASAALALTSSGSQFQTMLSTIGKSGTAADQAAIQMKGLGVSFKNLKDKIGLLALALGDSGLSQIMKGLIDISRFLVDAITDIVESGFGKFLVVASSVVGSIIAIEVAISGLTSVWATLTAVMGSSIIARAIGVMVVNFQALAAAAGFTAFTLGGPVVAALLAVSVGLAYVLGFMGKAGKSATIMAAEYSNLESQLKTYSITVAGMSKGSDDLKQANLSLRDSLLKTADEFSAVSIEATAAANSINPLSGIIDKNSNAIENYNKKLDSLRIDALVNATKQANNTMSSQGGYFNATVDTMKNAIKTLGMSFKEGLAFVEVNKSVDEFAKKIKAGTVSVAEMEKTIASWGDSSKFSSQQERIVSSYKEIVKEATNWVDYLIKGNNIGLDDTIENIEAAAKKAGAYGDVLKNVVAQMLQLKKASESTFTDTIGKWNVEGTSEITALVDNYKKLKGAMSDAQETEIRTALSRMQFLIDEKARLKASAILEEKTADDKQAVWKKYHTALIPLLNEADEIQRQLSENRAFQNIKLLGKETIALQKSLDINAAKYKGNYDKIEQYRAEDQRKFDAHVAQLLKGQTIDPAVQKADYQKVLAANEAAFTAYLAKIAAEEASGVITKEKAEALKSVVTEKFYARNYQLAIKYANLISKEDDSVTYEKRQLEVLKATEDYYKSRTTIVNKYNAEIVKLDTDVVKNQEKQVDELSKHNAKLEKVENSRVAKLLTIENSYAAKKLAINDALVAKLAAIDTKIADNKKSAANDVLTLENDTEEKIRNIKNKGLTDEQKLKSDKLAIANSLAKGNLLIAQAQKEQDKEKLASGVSLIKQAESILGGVNAEKDSISGLKNVLSSLSKARNVEAELKDLELLKEKEKEIADSAKAGIAAKEAYDNKIKAATVANTELVRLENVRHTNEMKNLKDEISLLKKKVVLANNVLAQFGGTIVPILDNTEVNKALKEISTATDGVFTEMENSGKSTFDTIGKLGENSAKQIGDGFSSDEIFSSMDENGVKTFTNIKNKGIFALDEIKKNVDGQDIFSSMDEDGVKTFTNIKDKGINALKSIGNNLDEQDIFSSVDEDGVKSFTNIKATVDAVVDDIGNSIEVLGENSWGSFSDSFDKAKIQIDTSFESLSKQAVTSIKKVETAVEKLIKTMAELKDKTVTITQKTVTTGSSSSSTTGYASGGRLPGFGGGDKIPLLGEGGEWMINKFAVKKYGDDFMSKINNLSLPRFATGGKIGIPKSSMTTKSSSLLGSLANFGTVSLDIGSAKIPAIINQDVVGELTSHLNNLKRFATT